MTLPTVHARIVVVAAVFLTACGGASNAESNDRAADRDAQQAEPERTPFERATPGRATTEGITAAAPNGRANALPSAARSAAPPVVPPTAEERVVATTSGRADADAAPPRQVAPPVGSSDGRG